MQDRVKPLEGVRNFRDFGGYDTPTGRVRSGLLFRSGHYNEATDDDLAFLHGLNVTFHVDLRRPDERDRQPNKWPAEHVRRVSKEGGRQQTPDHVAALTQENVPPDSISPYLTNYHREATSTHRHHKLLHPAVDRTAKAD